MLSKEQLQEFKRLYRERYGKDISDEEAVEQALKLLSLVKIVRDHAVKVEKEKQEEQT